MQTSNSSNTTATVDLLSHIDNEHLLKKLSFSISAATHIPVSSIFLLGLGVFSSIATRNYSVKYRDFGSIPIGLYTVLESPSGIGKSTATRIFQQPFYKSHKLANSNLPPDMVAPSLFTSNTTPEALEHSLISTKGFFAAISSEQGLFNSLFGISYGDGRQSNNDLVLNGFDAGFIDSKRITRVGYSGQVAGGISLFAQNGSIEKLLNASNGTGLSERFLMLSEPHNLGKRNHLETTPIDISLLSQYSDKCKKLTAIESPVEFEECQELKIDANGWRMINEYRNIIEPNLIDGGRYSHVSLRGFAAKVDMQIMKISANLHLLSNDVDVTSTISNEYVKSAILIVNDLLEHQLSMLTDKGLAGKNAAYDAILRMFDKVTVLTDRKITTSRCNVMPFKDMTGNKYEIIRNVLHELVNLGELVKTGDGTRATYTLNHTTPASTTSTTSTTSQPLYLLNSV
jgi:hypothetical protein